MLAFVTTRVPKMIFGGTSVYETDLPVLERSSVPCAVRDGTLWVAEPPKTPEEALSRKFMYDNWIEPTGPLVMPSEFVGSLE